MKAADLQDEEGHLFRQFLEKAQTRVDYDEELEQFNDGFAERILKSDLDDTDLKVYKIFLDIAMPAVSKTAFRHLMSFEEESMSTLLTVGEETFGFFVLENNIRRWVWCAKNEMENDSEDGNDGNERNNGSDGSGDIEEPKAPDLLYQKNKTRKKTSGGTNSTIKMLAGEYTDLGLHRFNVLAGLVKEHRKERSELERKITALYEEESDKEVIGRMRINRKRKVAGDNGDKTMKRKVEVINLLE